ncbi:MAG: aspartate--tRNA(Asn) ligase [Candidatus Micrarchaeota archaeon]
MMRTHYCSDVTAGMDGQKVRLAGWVHETRVFGKINFVILRDRSGLMQVIFKEGETSEALLQQAKSLVKETAVVVEGAVRASKIANAGRELVPSSLEVVGKVRGMVPFELTGKVPADLDVRLDNRFVDLRRIEVQAVFKVRAEVQRAFRETCLSLGFQEINPPCILESASEGGTDLFTVDYFGRKAFLAQSPQLYKQLAVLGGMDKVFMTTPVWRAEKHNTTQHLNEVTQMDAEMGFADDGDALDSLERVFIGMLEGVSKNCARELELLKSPLSVPKKVPRHSYSDLVDLLNKNGEHLAWGSDFSKEQEDRLSRLTGDEAFLITGWPAAARAFYSMPEADGKTCKAYDLMFRGIEIASGAQRIHDVELLEKALQSRNLNPADFKGYLDAFRYGAIPHAGWSIGAERLVMKLCNLQNIREAALFPRDRNRLTP